MKLGAVSLVITILGADYTGISSFGRVEDFSENLVCMSRT